MYSGFVGVLQLPGYISIFLTKCDLSHKTFLKIAVDYAPDHGFGFGFFC